MSIISQEEMILSNKKSWDEVAPRFFGRTALPTYGPYAPSENDLNLFGEVAGLIVLDIGCGSGHSLAYMASRGVAELWGIDLSDTQLEAARALVKSNESSLRLMQGPMEVDPGLPHQYFDIVYSIYAIGWTVDLRKTLQNAFHYLKPGGVFIFSWEHPLHNRIKYENGDFVVKKSYHEEGMHQSEAWNIPAMMNQIKLSTYLNELIRTGFQIESVIEDVALTEQAGPANPMRWYSPEKAALIPPTLIVKCSKPIKGDASGNG